MTVANDLLPLGYEMDVFESLPEMGGLIRSNIPKFRLPPEVIDEEFDPGSFHLLRVFNHSVLDQSTY